MEKEDDILSKRKFQNASGINLGNFMLDSLDEIQGEEVTEEVDAKDKETKTLVELAKLLQDDERVENVLLPVRDGLFMVRKK